MPRYSFDLKWVVNRPVTQTFSSIDQLIKSGEIKKLKIKKSMPYTYMLAKYRDREIQIGFENKAGYTTVSVKAFYKKPKERSEIEFALNELKWRLGGSDITTTVPVSREVIIKEMEVIKRPCPYCRTLIPMEVDRCPHCGGRLY
jgi:hypothetical protein